MPQVIGFLLIPVYTRFLNPSDYGIVEMSGVFSAFVMIFMRMALPGSITRFYYTYKEGSDLKDYVTSVFWLMKLIGLTVAVITGIIAYYFADRIIPGLPFWPFVVISLITAFLTTNSEIQKRLLQARRQSAYSAKLNIATAALGILLVLLFVPVLKMGALGFVLAGLIAAIVFFIQAHYYLKSDLTGSFKPSLLKHSVKYAIHILPSHLITPFCALFSRSLLSSGYSLEAVGVFAIANRFMSPLNIVSGAFSNSYIPVYFETRESNSEENIQKLIAATQRIWVLANIMFLGMAIAGPLFIVLLTPEKYHSGASLIPVLSLSFLIGVFYDMYTQELYYSKKTQWVSVIAGLRFLANIGVLLLTVNYLGIFSIPVSLLAESIVITVLAYYISRKQYRLKKDNTFLTLISVVSVLLASIQTIMLYKALPLHILILTGAFLLIVFIGFLQYKKYFNFTTLLKRLKKS